MSKMTLKTEGDTHVVITRHFAAPPEKVYKAHTDPKIVQKWCTGPDGWTMPVCISEPKPGGKIRYEWTNGKGGGFHLTGEYLECSHTARSSRRTMHLPDPTPNNHIETRIDDRRHRDADDDAHDVAGQENTGGNARYGNGKRDGSKLRPVGKPDIAEDAEKI